MSATFDSGTLEKHGWRQGAVLGPELLRVARERAPSGVTISDDDWLIVTSHDCDVVNDRLEKESNRRGASRASARTLIHGQATSVGPNPRVIQIQSQDESGGFVILSMRVHERWTLPREVLSTEPPARVLKAKERRLIAEWLAKRYIRAAFPSAFDERWRARMRDWINLLEKRSRWIQGVYVRLNTLDELESGLPYIVDLMVAVPASATKETGWTATRVELEREVEAFWSQLGPGIECAGVGVYGTNLVDARRHRPLSEVRCGLGELRGRHGDHATHRGHESVGGLARMTAQA